MKHARTYTIPHAYTETHTNSFLHTEKVTKKSNNNIIDTCLMFIAYNILACQFLQSWNNPVTYI